MKNIFSKLRLLSILLFFFTAFAAYGQKADEYFSEGKELKAKKMYQDAIAKFNSAKSLYNAAKKLSMVKSCNLEISECKKLLATKPKPKRREEAKKNAEVTDTVKAEPVVVTRNDVVLKLSVERLDFDYKPKEGATQSVEVDCNYDDWKAECDKEWVTIYITDKKFTVEVTENSTEEERSGVIKVKCGDKSVDLVVNQAKATQLNKITNAVGGLFKKKKKNK